MIFTIRKSSSELSLKPLVRANYAALEVKVACPVRLI